MKAILQSIKPKYCELIAAVIKKIEVRKTKPNVPTPFKVYIYCTKGEKLWKKGNSVFLDKRYNRLLQTFDYMLNGKVIGEYVCDSIDTLLESDTRGKWKDTAKASCLTFQQLDEYSGTDEKPLYLWHISNLVIYDKPKELSEFIYLCPEYTKERFNEKCRKCPHYFRNDFDMYFQCDCEGEKPITRPPQSWCYVEEV